MPPPLDRFAELVENWLTWLGHNRGRAPATVAKYRSYLQRLADWVATPPADPKRQPSCSDPLALTAEDLETFTGLHAHALGLTPRARRPLVSAVRGFYGWAKRSGRLPSNPSADLPTPKAGRPLPVPASLGSLEKLLTVPDVDTLAGLRDAAVLALLAGCALRLSGLCSLDEGALLWQTDDTGRRSLTLRVTEKGGRERLLPVPHEAAMLLRAYLAHPDLAAIDRTLATGDRVLFVSLRAPTIPPHEYHGERRRMSPRGVQRMIEQHAETAGIPRDQATPHALRHLYGAELAEDDQDVLMRQVLLGHADPKTTAIYSHLAARKLRKVVDKSNPLAKIRGPLLDSLRALDRAANPPSKPPIPRPSSAQKP
jgi:integrase/recombinase XerD